MSYKNSLVFVWFFLWFGAFDFLEQSSTEPDNSSNRLRRFWKDIVRHNGIIDKIWWFFSWIYVTIERFIRSILISMIKICTKCKNSNLRKDGKEDGRQRYRCLDCKYVFRSKRREKNTEKQTLFHSYSFRKQTLSEIAWDTHYSVRTIQRKLDEVFSSKKGGLFALIPTFHPTPPLSSSLMLHSSERKAFSLNGEYS